RFLAGNSCFLESQCGDLHVDTDVRKSATYESRAPRVIALAAHLARPPDRDADLGRAARAAAAAERRIRLGIVGGAVWKVRPQLLRGPFGDRFRVGMQASPRRQEQRPAIADPRLDDASDAVARRL